jgi:hypothetical protein
MNATFTTPSEAIAAATLTGTRKEQVIQKRATIKAWLETAEGSSYLAALQSGTAGLDSYNQMMLEKAGLRDLHEDKGRLVKSKAGNWGRQIGSRASMLTRRECEAAGVVPGRANT